MYQQKLSVKILALLTGTQISTSNSHYIIMVSQDVPAEAIS
jgi:hypothetical protein